MFGIKLKQEIKEVPIDEVNLLIGKVEIIDIRETYEYRTGSIPTAKNIPMGELVMKPEKYLEKDKLAYIICQSGMRSNRTTQILTRNGYSVVSVGGGISSYKGKLV